MEKCKGLDYYIQYLSRGAMGGKGKYFRRILQKLSMWPDPKHAKQNRGFLKEL